METVAAAFVLALRRLAISKGAGGRDLDRQSGITAEELDDPDGRVDIERYKALLRAAKDLTGDAALALHFGEAFDLSELSIVGLMGHASENMADAFELLGRFSRLAVDVELEEWANGQRLVMKREGNKIWLVDTRKDPNDFPEITESSFARMFTAARELGGNSFISAVHVTHPAPAYADEYQRIFKVPVVFDAKWNAIALNSQSWKAVSPRFPSSYTNELLRERADKLINRLDAARTTRLAVESRLNEKLSEGNASMTSVAADLCMSRTTLFRRLRREGVTFHQVRDEIRARLAPEYLGRGCSVGEVSQLLGFSEAASFSRAFKRWTGKTPRSFIRRPRPDASTRQPTASALSDR